MIFKYSELKEYINNDFYRFHTEFRFNEKQIFPAILDEYKYGEDFCDTENICIHVFVLLHYIQKNMNCDNIVDSLERLIKKIDGCILKNELDEDYILYKSDILYIQSKLQNIKI